MSDDIPSARTGRESDRVPRRETPGSRWAVWRGIRASSECFRTSAVRVPRRAWLAWAATLAVGAVSCAGLTAVAALAARALHGRGMQAWDRALLLRVEQLPLAWDAAVWWQGFGASSMLIPVTVVAVILSLRTERPVLAAEFLAAFALAKPIFLVGWLLWDRARPDLIAGGIAAPSFHSFPSGHAVQSATVYGLLTYLWLRRSFSTLEWVIGVSAWLALVAMVGLARLRTGVHWPSDVIVGTLIGIAWLATLLTALRRAEAAGGC